MAEVRPIKLLDVGSGAGQLKEFEDGDAVPDSSRLGGQLPSHYATQSDLAGVTPGPEFYKRSNILGTVSQSAGVPTGAIIERGRNANGEYVRWADGTQICTKTVLFSTAIAYAYGSMFLSPVITAGAWPSAFVAAPRELQRVETGFGSWTVHAGPPSTTNAAPFQLVRAIPEAPVAYGLGIVAIGRWY